MNERTPDGLAAAWGPHAVVQLARVSLGFLPAGALWGLDAVRYAPPALGVAAVVLALLAAVPRAAGALLTASREVARLPDPARLFAAAALPALVAWCLPDRTRFSGDVLQRLGVVAVGNLATAFPQTLPLDALLHQHLVPALAGALGGSLVTANRVLEAAAVLGAGLVAAAFARGGRATTGPAVVALATGFSGLLLAATGSGRPEAFVALLAVVVVGATYRDLATPSRWPVAETAFVAGLLLHRSMALLAPVVIVLGARILAGRPSPPSGRRPFTLLLGLLALTGVPRYVQVLAGFDTPHHLAPHGWSGAVLAAALAPRHVLEVFNVLLLVAPALPLLAIALGKERRATSAAFRAVAPLALVPWLLALLFAHPQQGLFRDSEVFAPLGAIAGFLLGLHLAREGERGWESRFVAAVLLALAASMLAPLALWATPGTGRHRIAVFASDPSRGPAHRADAWSFLATSYEGESRLREASEAASRAFALQPTPRSRAQALFTAVHAGAYADARRVALGALAEGRGGALEWLAAAGAARALGDSVAAAAEADSLRARLRSPRERALVRVALGFRPELWPGERPAWLKQALEPGAPAEPGHPGAPGAEWPKTH